MSTITSNPSPNTPDAPLSQRGMYRLRIAARMLRAKGVRFRTGGGHQQVILALNRRPDREFIRECVDWVEAYDRAAACGPSSGVHAHRTLRQPYKEAR